MTVDGKDHHPQATTPPQRPLGRTATLTGLSASFNRQQTTKAIVTNRPPTPRLPLLPPPSPASSKRAWHLPNEKKEIMQMRTQEN